MSQTTTNNFIPDNKESFDNDAKSLLDVQSESQNFESSVDIKVNSITMNKKSKEIRSSFKKDKDQVEMSTIKSNDLDTKRDQS